MSFKEKVERWFQDAKTVWHSAGGARPFSRRSTSEAEILKEYREFEGEGKRSGGDADKPPSKGQPPKT